MEELNTNVQEKPQDSNKSFDNYNNKFIHKDDIKTIPNKNKYAIKQKLNIINEVNGSSNHSVSNKYGID